MNFKETNTEVIKKWKSGDLVSTAELGGLGPGYEQAIQNILFETLSSWDTNLPLEKEEEGEKKYSDEFTSHVDAVVSRLDDGHSGAQVGVAKSTAYQFINFGYSHMMNKLEEDRIIQVSKPEDIN